MRIKLQNSLGLYPVKTIDLPEGLTYLVGCNGAGKSSLIAEIKRHFDANGFRYSKVDCIKDFTHSDAANFDACYRMSTIVNVGFRSEHEHYEDLFYDWISTVRPPDSFKGRSYAIFIDGLDSGSDVVSQSNHIDLFKLIVQDAERRGIHIYLIVTCNNFQYLTTDVGNMILVPSLKIRSLPAYDITEFASYVDDIRQTAIKRGFIKK